MDRMQQQALRDFRYWRKQCARQDDVLFYDREIARLQEAIKREQKPKPAARKRIQRSATGYRGVNFIGDGRRRPYLAYIHTREGGVVCHAVVGYYATAEQAARAHDDAVRERGLHKQPLNFEVKDE